MGIRRCGAIRQSTVDISSLVGAVLHNRHRARVVRRVTDDLVQVRAVGVAVASTCLVFLAQTDDIKSVVAIVVRVAVVHRVVVSVGCAVWVCVHRVRPHAQSKAQSCAADQVWGDAG